MVNVVVHAVETGSQANGPGRRSVVWFQGCSLGCAGCFNPETHAAGGGEFEVGVLVDELVVRDPLVQGLTVSGGEPLEQPGALRLLVELWTSRTGTGVIVLTGMSWGEVCADSVLLDAVAGCDVVIAGRFNERLRVASGLRGSSNKTYHFLSDRYALRDILDVPEFEVVISPEGSMHVSGVAGSQPLIDLLGHDS